MNRRVIAHLALTLGALVMAAPFALLILTSLMRYEQTVSYPPEWIPSPATLENYRKALVETKLLGYFFNSLIVSVVSVAGQIVTGAMAGFAFARFRFPGRDGLFFIVLASMLVPIHVNLVPLFVLMTWMGWVDSYQALILPGITGAFGVFMFRQWFLNLPKELEEAARLDGCTPWGYFWRIAMPTALPAIATLGIIEFLTTWNSFLWPLIITNSDALRTLPVGLAAFRSSMKEVTDWALLMAATTVSVLPAVAVFLLGQRYFIRGLMEGGVKD